MIREEKPAMAEETKVNNDTAGAPNVNLLSTLLSNPDLIRRVGAMLGAAQSTGTTPEPDAKSTDSTLTEAPQAAPTSTGVTQDGLSALLSDPTMLEKLPQIIAVMKPLMGAMPSPQPPKEEKASSPELCRDNLLCALKPFLSPSRCEAVDTIMRISKLGTVFKQLT
jgi:hypothetical protein